MSLDPLRIFDMIIGLFLSIEENNLLLLGTSVAVSIFTLMAGTYANSRQENVLKFFFFFSQY